MAFIEIQSVFKNDRLQHIKVLKCPKESYINNIAGVYVDNGFISVITRANLWINKNFGTVGVSRETGNTTFNDYSERYYRWKRNGVDIVDITIEKLKQNLGEL